MLNKTQDALAALAEKAEVAPLDLDHLRRQANRRRRRRNGLTGALVLSLVATVGGTALYATNSGPSVLRQAVSGQSWYLRVVTPQDLDFERPPSEDLAPEVEDCLPEEAERPGGDFSGTLVRLNTTAAAKDEVVACLEAVDGVQVFPQDGPDFAPVVGLGGEPASLTDEQARRAGVDATEECSVPGVREAAPPFEGETPLPTATVVAAYLTDGRGYPDWAFEYRGVISGNSDELPPDGLIRLCWYQNGEEYQLVESAVGGGTLPNSSTRAIVPIPVLAPPPPRSMSSDEVRERLVTFEQPA